MFSKKNLAKVASGQSTRVAPERTQQGIPRESLRPGDGQEHLTNVGVGVAQLWALWALLLHQRNPVPTNWGPPKLFLIWTTQETMMSDNFPALVSAWANLNGQIYPLLRISTSLSDKT